MNYNLFLDDFRKPEEAYQMTNNKDYLEKDWIICKKYQKFVDCIEQNGLPELFSFDHDLSAKMYSGKIPYSEMKVKSGWHCAVWLIDYCKKNNLQLPAWKIHTVNKLGYENIKAVLEKFDFSVK